jgi:hypothetical protein
MWCIGNLNLEHHERMYGILELYQPDYNEDIPIICIDEKSKQIISDSNKRKPFPSKTGSLEKIDYEYVRHRTCNFF